MKGNYRFINYRSSGHLVENDVTFIFLFFLRSLIASSFLDAI
jgi:hypothetical protein